MKNFDSIRANYALNSVCIIIGFYLIDKFDHKSDPN